MISKNRKKELEYFCKQYYEWKAELAIRNRIGTSEFDDPTGDEAVRIYELNKKIEIIDECILNVAGEYLAPFLKKHICEGATYEYLRTKLSMQYGRRQFYEVRDIFFINLSRGKHMF